jgi:hypothetical protein
MPVIPPPLDQIARRDRIRGFQHRVGEGQVEADVEGHQRPDDMLGLRILPARRATVEVTSESIMATQV